MMAAPPELEVKLPEPVPFHAAPCGGEVILQVCQGLGDILWVYQKWAPYVDGIHWRIAFQGNKTLAAERSVPWLYLLPKTRKALMRGVEYGEYPRLANKPYTMAETWERRRRGGEGTILEYSCNAWLDAGVRLEQIDPGSLLEESPVYRSEPWEVPFPQYMVLYVSGDTRHLWLQRSPKHRVWTIQQWVRCVKLARKAGVECPVVLIGAEFDRGVTETLAAALRTADIETSAYNDLPPAKVVHLLKGASLFLGYQSGLNVVADHLDVRQLMVYFPHLRPMHYAWCKPRNADVRYFPASFEDEPEAVIEQHAAKLFDRRSVLKPDGLCADAFSPCPVRIVPKLWGREEILVNRGDYCAKVLVCLPNGNASSIHSHKVKTETFHVLSGALELELFDGRGVRLCRRKLTPESGSLTISPGTPHRFWTERGECRFLEASTHDDPKDSYRLVNAGPKPA